MTDERIARINELARIAKQRALTVEEETERAELRAEYLAAVRANLRAQLDGITVVEKDGSKHKLGKK